MKIEQVEELLAEAMRQLLEADLVIKKLKE
jgi:hypothetical protein